MVGSEQYKKIEQVILGAGLPSIPHFIGIMRFAEWECEFIRVLRSAIDLGISIENLFSCIDSGFKSFTKTEVEAIWKAFATSYGNRVVEREYERDTVNLLSKRLGGLLEDGGVGADIVFELLQSGFDPINPTKMFCNLRPEGRTGFQFRTNICRKSSGGLRAAEELLRLPINKTTARMLCDSAIGQDDLEAVELILAMEPFESFIDGAYVKDRVEEVGGKRWNLADLPKLKVASKYYSQSLQAYVNSLANIRELTGGWKHDPSILENVFDKKLVSMAPAQFVKMFMTPPQFSVMAANHFITLMLENGIPIREGLRMVIKGEFEVIQYPNRDLTDDEIIEKCFLNKTKRGYIAALFAVPIPTIANHQLGQKVLRLMYGYRALPEIQPYLNNGNRSQMFVKDLGV